MFFFMPGAAQRCFFFFSSRRRHTRLTCDWSSDVCSSDLAISSDGVSINASVVVRFRLQRDAVPVLHQAIGPNYEKILVQPGIGSLTREVIAQYTAEQVYSTARQEIQDKIRSLAEDRL